MALERLGAQIEIDAGYVLAKAPKGFGTEPSKYHSDAVFLKGPLTTPVGGGFRSINVALRQELDLFASIRPCKLYEGVRSHFDQVDIVTVRVDPQAGRYEWTKIWDNRVSKRIKTIGNQSIEGEIKRLISGRLSRGRVDVNLQYERTDEINYELNRPMITGYLAAMKKMQDEFGLSGEPDLNKDGLPRVCDSKPDQPTYLFERGTNGSYNGPPGLQAPNGVAAEVPLQLRE